jgi:hypothetical protein
MLQVKISADPVVADAPGNKKQDQVLAKAEEVLRKASENAKKIETKGKNYNIL